MANRMRVAAFGEVMMRLQVPGYELLTQAGSLNYSFSGTGVNVSAALGRYGYESYLISRLPDNPIGDAAAVSLRKLGIATDFIQQEGNALGMYFLENGFGPRPSRVTYANRQLSSFNTAAADAYDYEAIAGHMDAIHFCGITLAMNDTVRRHMFALAEAVKAQGGKIIFDCNYRTGQWGEDGYARAKPFYEQMLQLADIVMMNEQDALLLLGMTTDKAERLAQLQALMPMVASEYGIGTLAGTHRAINRDHTHTLLGFLYQDRAFAFSDPLTFAVHDRIGAGDAFASGIIHGQLSCFAPERTVRFAAAAAMLAHTVTGDTPMSQERDILRAMTEMNGDVRR